jgi:hypothetical protein
VTVHDPFGRSRIPESVFELRRRVVVTQRLEEFRRAAHLLVQATDPGIAGTGARMLVWLDKGGNLAKVLGVLGERGAHRVKL